MNKRHIYDFAVPELERFLKEEMEEQKLVEWQQHYHHCHKCRKYVDNAPLNRQLIEQGEKAVEELIDEACEDLYRKKKQIREHLMDAVKNIPSLYDLLCEKVNNDIIFDASWAIAASSSYQPGEKYTQMEFSIPLPQDRELSAQIDLQWIFSFHWTNMVWGHIELDIAGTDEFTSQQQKTFLQQFVVDLYTAQNEKLYTDLHVDHNGNFVITEIDEEIEQLKQYLQQKSLRCMLKLKKSPIKL